MDSDIIMDGDQADMEEAGADTAVMEDGVDLVATEDGVDLVVTEVAGADTEEVSILI